MSVLRLRRALPAAVIAAGIGLSVIPLIFLLLLSLKRNDEVFNGNWLPQQFNFGNWPDAFYALPQFLGVYVGHSWIVAVGAAVITIFFAFPGAVYSARAGKRGERLLGLALAAYCAPPIIAMIPFFLLLRRVDLLNTLTGLTLVNGLVNIPIAIWLLDGFIRRLPREIEEAAWIDGATATQTLFKVILPIAWPGVLATGLICVFIAYSEFLFAVSFGQSQSSQTLSVALSVFQSSGKDINYGKVAVASLTGILPMYALALLSQRWLVAGLTAGAVK